MCATCIYHDLPTTPDLDGSCKWAFFTVALALGCGIRNGCILADLDLELKRIFGLGAGNKGVWAWDDYMG
jgi:hypothetical protein